SDVELLTHIAGQVAIAFQNSLNFQRATKAQERTQTLLDATTAITTTFDLRELLRITSSCLRRYFNHDVTGLALYDENTNTLLVHAIDRDRHHHDVRLTRTASHHFIVPAALLQSRRHRTRALRRKHEHALGPCHRSRPPSPRRSTYANCFASLHRACGATSITTSPDSRSTTKTRTRSWSMPSIVTTTAASRRKAPLSRSTTVPCHKLLRRANRCSNGGSI